MTDWRTAAANGSRSFSRKTTRERTREKDRRGQSLTERLGHVFGGHIRLMDDFRKAFHRNFQLWRVELVAKQQHFHAPDLLFKSTEQKKKERKKKKRKQKKKQKKKRKRKENNHRPTYFFTASVQSGVLHV
jgi:hypothetical protein